MATIDLDLLVYVLVLVAYLGLALAVILRSRLNASSFWLSFACVITAAWAGFTAFSIRFDGSYSALISPMETLKAASFAGLLVVMLYPTWKLRERAHYTFFLAVALGFVFALQLAVDLLGWLGVEHSPFATAPKTLLAWLPRLATSIGGLLLVENVYRNAGASYRWRIKLLVFAIGALFAFDIFLYSGPAISGRIAEGSLTARAIIHLLVVPLLIVSIRRNVRWTGEFQVSRKVVFHSLSLIAVGLYLLGTSALAYMLRIFGGAWGPSLQIAAVAAGLVSLLVILASAQARSWLKVKVLKHFFAYRYDYREEWLRLIGTIGQGNASSEPLERRIMRAIADLLDSPGGSLWVRDDFGDFVCMEAVGSPKPPVIHLDVSDPMVDYMRSRTRIVDLDHLRDGHPEYDGASAPSWLRESTVGWIVVPLFHLERMIGFAIVDRPGVSRQLDWEDFDLLKTVGRQAGSYLAEQMSQRAVIEATRFDDFNRRFAFIVHDIKNLVSQLSLVSRNAERHADNPEFRADMVETLRNSVSKMNDLLLRLREHHGPVEAFEPVDVAELLRAIVSEKQKSHPMLSLHCESDDCTIAAPRERLAQVFGHLIQNAIEASGPDMAIRVGLGARPGFLDVEIADTGCGMTEEFIRNELFKPFSTTKTGGYGIGAYEAREIVRSLKGVIHVRSAPGEGSTFIVRLPVAQTPALYGAAQ